MSKGTDRIELLLPFKAEYVSLARLTASGIANRVGFDIETIEDIKVAISEVCNRLVSLGSNKEVNYKIIYKISENKLEVTFECEDESLRCIFNGEDEKLGVSIITALMDEVELCGDKSYILTMSKALEGEG